MGRGRSPLPIWPLAGGNLPIFRGSVEPCPPARACHPTLSWPAQLVVFNPQPTKKAHTHTLSRPPNPGSLYKPAVAMGPAISQSWTLQHHLRLIRLLFVTEVDAILDHEDEIIGKRKKRCPGRDTPLRMPHGSRIQPQKCFCYCARRLGNAEGLQ